MTESRSSDHFAQLYRSNPDPWGFTTSAYERAKYQTTLQVLGQRSFESGLEVGCSVGVLTRMLAPQCVTLVGVDIVEDPLPAARARCADYPGVRFERMQVPLRWPTGHFDLIVFSEVLYFLSAEDIGHCARHVQETLLPGGVVVLVNWLGKTDDPSPADAAPARFIAAVQDTLHVVRQERHEHYRLDVLTSA